MGWDLPPFAMTSKQISAYNLAAAFLNGTWSLESLVRRAALACGKRQRWMRSLARRTLATFADQSSRRSVETIAAFIADDPSFHHAWARRDQGHSFLHRIFWVIPRMTPAAGVPSTWEVPDLPTAGALADWLDLKVTELDWFADCRRLEGKVPSGPLRHYTYHWLIRPSGKARLLEAPKQRLKAIQRRLLHDLLDYIPPHAAAHGFRKGRSIATYAQTHTGREIVLRFDLRDFFPSIRSSRVHALFQTAGYPPAVARLLTGLCTNVVPWDVWQGRPPKEQSLPESDRWHLFCAPHLPQGSPTSGTLANLCAYRLDCRLAGLASSVGANYTRYADDLAFSGDPRLERCARRFQIHVCRIALEEGFEINPRKTFFMRQGVRQQLAGVVVNAHPNVQRPQYERLKAILCNCVRHGPESQNREGRSDFRGYLAGRIAYLGMLNAARGQKLRALFERISWEG
jgi:hypothetical protein